MPVQTALDCLVAKDGAATRDDMLRTLLLRELDRAGLLPLGVEGVGADPGIAGLGLMRVRRTGLTALAPMRLPKGEPCSRACFHRGTRPSPPVASLASGAPSGRLDGASLGRASDQGTRHS